MARQHVTVSLSGDAGDELFGGYYRYIMADTLWKRIGWLPGPLRQLTTKGLRSLSTESWLTIANMLMKGMGKYKRLWMTGDKVHKLATALDFKERDDIYRNFLRHWRESKEIVLGANEPYQYWGLDKSLPEDAHFVESMMYHDTLTYLPNDILTKVD